MESEFVPYEEALELKELGYDKPCLGFYGGGFEESKRIFELNDNSDSNRFRKNRGLKAPLYPQAFRWFRDKHQLFYEIQVDQTSYPKYCFEIHEFIGNPKDLTEKHWGWKSIPNDESWGLYRSYEEAELNCLKKLIKIVKNGQSK